MISMSTSHDSCCLPSVKKQKHDFQVFAFVQCIIKQLLDSVFVMSRIIKVSVRVISLSLRLRLITLTSILIILDITKTSSNNCLKARKQILPFVTTYHPSVRNLKNILMQNWGLIQNQPLLNTIFKNPPILSYRRGKSLTDILVKAKL